MTLGKNDRIREIYHFVPLMARNAYNGNEGVCRTINIRTLLHLRASARSKFGVVYPARRLFVAAIDS